MAVISQNRYQCIVYLTYDTNHKKLNVPSCLSWVSVPFFSFETEVNRHLSYCEATNSSDL